jgi:lysyl-tRNA synthetase class 2
MRSEQEVLRFQKLKKLREKGFSFPNDVKPTILGDKFKTVEIKEGEEFTVCGRITQKRVMGKAMFLHILDSQAKIQLYGRKDELADYEDLSELDLGDIISATGAIFITKTGERTIHIKSWKLLVKALVPLPEKWHGLSDVEARYRYRYLDLISNPEVRESFKKRSLIVQKVREFLVERGFLEVETPVLHYVPAGASAKPFKTHHNSLGIDMFLRVALELPLKKLVVGGLERVFEIGRNFRNEGISRKHNPEFTMLEFYQAYATFEDLMDLTEEMFLKLADEVVGSRVLQYGEVEVNLASPWKRISMENSIREIGGVEGNLRDLNTLHQVAAHHKIHIEEKNDWGRCIEALWGELVEPKLINPTFITHHPFSISPLARKTEGDPLVTDRFELIIAGMEMANAFSELNDAEDQRERFEEQARRKNAGDEEAHDVDEDFLRALEVGLPPTAGEGIGIDRLVMLFTNSTNIRDVVLFPQLKPDVV